MAINIEKMRADMDLQNKQLAWETRKFVVSIIVAFAAAIGAGAALGNYYARHEPLPVPALPPQVIFQPGSIVVTAPPVVPAPAVPPAKQP